MKWLQVKSSPVGSFVPVDSKVMKGVPIVAQKVKNPASVRENAGSIPGLWVKDPALLPAAV